jgi:glycerol uptake operon antiterminator
MSERECESREPALEGPVIAALRSKADIEALARHPMVRTVFLLYGSIGDGGELVARCHDFGKTVFLHFDLLRGVAGDADAMAFVARRWRPEGIITTRPQVIAAASRHGLASVQRIFALDSLAVDTGIQLVRSARPTAVEVLPGVVPRVIRRLVAELTPPVIAGGLIQDGRDVRAALAAGARAVSSSRQSVWGLVANGQLLMGTTR